MKWYIMLLLALVLISSVYGAVETANPDVPAEKYLMKQRFNASTGTVIPAAETGQAFTESATAWEIIDEELYFPDQVGDEHICVNIAPTQNVTFVTDFNHSVGDDYGLRFFAFSSSGCGGSTILYTGRLNSGVWYWCDGAGCPSSSGYTIENAVDYKLETVIDITNERVNHTLYSVVNNSGAIELTVKASRAWQGWSSTGSPIQSVQYTRNYNIGDGDRVRIARTVAYNWTNESRSQQEPEVDADTSPPVLVAASFNTTTTPLVSERIAVSALWNDGFSLSHINISSNATGSKAVIAETVILSDPTLSFNLTNALSPFTIPYEGAVINFSTEANDTAGNHAEGTIAVIAVQSLDPVITASFNFNNTKNNTVPFSFNISVSDDSAFDNLCLLTNSSDTLYSLPVTQEQSTAMVLAAGQSSLNQNFMFSLVCYDNSVFNNSWSYDLNMTLDDIDPVITVVSPEDTAEINKNVTETFGLNVSCTDNPAYRLNATILYPNSSVFLSVETIAYGSQVTIGQDISTAPLPVGLYTVNYQCADPHTAQDTRVYNIRKREEAQVSEIDFQVPDNEITVSYEGTVQDFGAVRSGSDRYRFWFNPDRADGSLKSYVFEVRSRKPVSYIPQSGYAAHFVTGTSWIDFETDAEASYYVTTNAGGNYEVTVTTRASVLNFLSVGDLNIAEAQTTFTVVNTAPTNTTGSSIAFNQCVFTASGTGSILFVLFSFALAVAFIVLGKLLRTSLVGAMGGIIIFTGSLWVFTCSFIMGLIFMLGGFVVAWYFFSRGYSGSL